MTVFAVDELNEAVLDSEVTDSDLTVNKLVLSESDVPEVIDFVEAQEKGHVLRLRSKETDENTVVFLNDDNTETMYLFAEPIKYTDEHGNSKDKSTALTTSNNAYRMIDNDVQVSFSYDITQGITLNKDSVNITMTPVSTIVNDGKLNAEATASLATVNDNKISYSNVFQNAELVYTPLFSGFKEDIVLEEYSGINEFSFIVNTNGLCPVKQENGAVWFYDPDSNAPVAKMMQVVCYDSAYNFAEGDVRIIEVKQNEIYGFTIVADAAFLSDENTVYPVCVDPTLTTKNDSEVGIEDTVVYSGKPTHNYGDYKYLNVGYVDSAYKCGTMMIRFPTLANNSVFQNITANDITSATLSIYTASGKSETQALNLYYLTSEWTASSATYNSVFNASSPIHFSHAVVPASGGQEMIVNITQHVKSWSNGTNSSSPSKGFCFANTNTTDANKCRDFLSAEYALSSSARYIYMPNLEITFNSFSRIIVTNHPTSLSVGETYTCSAKYIKNGYVYATFNGTNFGFTSSNENILTTSNGVFTGILKGISPGTARVTVSYGTLSTYFDVTVNNASFYSGKPSGGYVWNNHGSRACDINARFGTHEADQNITYSIASKSGVYLDGFSIDANTGILRYNGEINLNNNEIAHPTGTINVKASYFGQNRIIPVKVKCTDYNVNGSSSNLEPITEVRWLRIGYNIIDVHNNENTSQNNTAFADADDAMLGVLLNYMTGTNPDANNYIYNEDYDDHLIGTTSHANFFKLIQNSEVVIIQTHGSENSFSINSKDSSITVTTDDILSLHQGYFSRCKLIICLLCNGANGSYDPTIANSPDNNPSEMSIIQAFADRGAKCVVGFYGNITVGEVDIFQKNFICSLSNGTYNSNTGFEYNEEQSADNTQNRTYNYFNACYTAFGEMAQGGYAVTSTSHSIDGREFDVTTYRSGTTDKIIMIGEDKYAALLD